MASWDLLLVLPNLELTEAIEASAVVAFAPGADERVQRLLEGGGASRSLLTGFTDDFGRKAVPTALIMREDAPDSLRDHYALASFRNLVALAGLIRQWTAVLAGGHGLRPLWADYFDFYPAAPSNDNEGILGRSLAKLTVDSAEGFTGTSSPQIAPWSGELAMDEPVFRACLAEWRRRFSRRRMLWRGRALFRSLEIAFRAARVPAVGTRFPSVHQLGANVADWVSAFEILKPNRNSRSNLRSVLSLLGRHRFDAPELRRRAYTVRNMGGTPINVNGSARVNYVQKLYGELYLARCNFLHGNPVTVGNLFPRGDRGDPLLLQLAPLVYRTALLSYLPAGPQPRGETARAMALVDRMFNEGRYESALRACQG